MNLDNYHYFIGLLKDPFELILYLFEDIFRHLYIGIIEFKISTNELKI